MYEQAYIIAKHHNTSKQQFPLEFSKKGNQTSILHNTTNDQQLNGIIQQKRKALHYI